jgi:hypothetical protein
MYETTRKYLRHITSIPITYNIPHLSREQQEQLTNISLGGLSFKSKIKLDKGKTLTIKFPNMIPKVKFKGSVVWCTQNNGFFNVGVKFFNNEDVSDPKWLKRFIMLNIMKKNMGTDSTLSDK